MSSVVLSPAMPSPAITCSVLATCNSTVVITPSSTPAIITPHAQRERGKVIGRGVHILYIIYIIYVCGRKKYLNRTLEIDSPFQTLTVGLLVEFID